MLVAKKMTKNRQKNNITAQVIIYRVINSLVVVVFAIGMIYPKGALADAFRVAQGETIKAASALVPAEARGKAQAYRVKKVRKTFVTAYSSTPDQTDDTPFITANGKIVYDGLVAANFLRFGTKVRFPELFGEKVFTVDDRMNARFGHRMDIWMKSREAALDFGAKPATVEILVEEPNELLARNE